MIVTDNHGSTDRKSWYVLMTKYNCGDKMADVLAHHGLETYIAQKYRWTRGDEAGGAELEYLIPDVLFACLSRQELSDIRKSADACLSSRFQPIAIPDDEMRNFMLATATHDRNIVLLDCGKYTLKSDCDVQVTLGPYKGVCGKLIRAYRQQRVLVRLQNFISIGTPYIPTSCLQELR